jgi:TatD DNase family protein
MVLIDTHCHLFLREFATDLEVVLSRALENRVEAILVVGIDAKTSQQAIQMAERYDGIYAAIGIHPNSQVVDIDDELKKIKPWLFHPKVVAVGEIGLDYYREHVSASDQKYRLLRQLDFASEAGLPVIIHNRNAVEDLFPLMSKWVEEKQTNSQMAKSCYGVFHSFSEDEHWARHIVNLGFFIGISGVITFPNARKIKDVVRAIPVANFLVETDAPYLSPQPFRGKRNEPSYLRYTLQGMASLLQIAPEALANTTTFNAQTLFGKLT